MAGPTAHSPSLASAQANPAGVFQFPGARVSLLTPRLARIELSPTGQFEDRPSQAFWFRDQPVPAHAARSSGQRLTLETEFFRLVFSADAAENASAGPQILLKDSGARIHLDDPNPGRLPGTARTLDETNGPIELQPGFVSRSGWVTIDDTPSLVFNPEGWLEARPAWPGYRDLYLLACGRDYPAALRDYQLVSGFPSLLPRAMLGNWWSRYWAYSQAEIQALVERFAQERIPLAVFIIDMDWHVTRTGNACSGWTGFTWNRELFPDPPGLLAWLHERGLISALNLHPAEGIHPHEERYPQATRALGLDPQAARPIRFDIADPRFARIYFEQLLHPLEAEGVDFWWIDWQQGERSRLTNLDPLWWLNHLHFYDLARDGGKRPVIFSRWGGPGNQRYPVGFSGDTIVSWASLAYQPYFTAAAANAAYGWWSHDIGGHMRGMEDGELYTRWVQFGALSPILRLHCSNDPFIRREPWSFDAEVLRLARQAMQFRHALVPYLYTLARRNEREGLPPVTPLYYDWPEDENAYLAARQYRFGDQLLAAPVTTPLDPDLRQSREAVWFPPGEWFDFFNGERNPGGRWTVRYASLEEIPLFAQAGVLVPLQSDITRNGCANPDQIDLLAFPGADGTFTLYEDDGVSLAYRQTGGCETRFASTWTGETMAVEICAPNGGTGCVPPGRAYRVLFRGVRQPEGCRAWLDGQPLDLPLAYAPETRTASVGPVELGAQRSLRVEVYQAGGALLAPEPGTAERVLRLLRRARMPTLTKWRLSTLIDKLQRDIHALARPDLDLTESQRVALIETVTGAGAAALELPQGGRQVVLVNPNRRRGFQCRAQEPVRIAFGGSAVAGPVEVDYYGLVKKTL